MNVEFLCWIVLKAQVAMGYPGPGIGLTPTATQSPRKPPRTAVAHKLKNTRKYSDRPPRIIANLSEGASYITPNYQGSWSSRTVEWRAKDCYEPVIRHR